MQNMFVLPKTQGLPHTCSPSALFYNYWLLFTFLYVFYWAGFYLLRISRAASLERQIWNFCGARLSFIRDHQVFLHLVVRSLRSPYPAYILYLHIFTSAHPSKGKCAPHQPFIHHHVLVPINDRYRVCFRLAGGGDCCYRFLNFLMVLGKFANYVSTVENDPAFSDG